MKKKKIRIAIIVVLVVIFAMFGVFGIYVSDYYKAEVYAMSEDNYKAEYDEFYIYGDSVNAKKGLIFYPGGKVETLAYEPIMDRLSQQGICCVLVKMPCNLAVFGANKAEEVINDVNPKLEWYIAGHSLGGAMAADFVSENPESIEGLILLAAYSTVELDENIRVLSLYGSEDKVINLEKYEEGKTLVENFEEVVIEGGNHGGFGNYGEQEGDGEATINKGEQWDVTVSEICEFINDRNE